MIAVVETLIKNIMLGPMQAHNGLGVFPIHFNGLYQQGPKYLLLGEAIKQGHVSITEISDVGSVPELSVINHNKDRGVLLLDGEQLLGCKQDRALNTTILVSPDSRATIPVSCVQQGRWRRTSREFSDSNHVMPGSSRRNKMRSVSSSLKTGSGHRSDQSSVWRDVNEMSRDSGTSSETGAMSDSYESSTVKPTLDEFVAAIPCQANQVGLLITIGGVVTGLDILSDPVAFHQVHEKLLRSYSFDAIREHQKQVNGKRLAKDAKAFLRMLPLCAADTFASPGIGQDIRFNNEDVIGSALVVDNTVIHLSVFSNAEHQSPQNPREREVAGIKNRVYQRQRGSV